MSANYVEVIVKIKMKTGADQDGKMLAHKVDIIADTGAYATLGPAVLDFAVEHAQGPYLIPNVSIEGISIYTNNGIIRAVQRMMGTKKERRLDEAFN